jgi:hypothetical protein
MLQIIKIELLWMEGHCHNLQGETIVFNKACHTEHAKHTHNTTRETKQPIADG